MQWVINRNGAPARLGERVLGEGGRRLVIEVFGRLVQDEQPEIRERRPGEPAPLPTGRLTQVARQTWRSSGLGSWWPRRRSGGVAMLSRSTSATRRLCRR
jgi:hypothetical protein